jgi:MFS family permease
METSLDTGAGAAAVPQPSAPPAPGTVYSVLGAISFSHMLNDMIQSLILAIYPMLKSQFALSFAQIGLITLTYQITASLLQPLVGLYTDKRPKPYSLPVGMGFTLAGLLLMSAANSFRCCWSRRHWWAAARRCSIRNRRAWRGWRRAAGTGSRSRCSRSAATPAPRSGRCSPRW